MRIECLFQEIDNIVSIGGVKYHFRREGDDRSRPMVADVADISHAQAIIGMSGFRAVEQVQVHEDDRGEGADGEGADGGDVDPALVDMTFDELRELYRERFSKSPHPAMRHETLLAKLSEQPRS